jgi:hypothetical protein
MFSQRSRVTTAALGALLLFVLPGCIALDTPLSDPMLSKADAGLCGVWTCTDDSSTQEILFIGINKGEAGTPPGLMRFALSSYSPTSKAIDNLSWNFTTTQVNGSSYANLIPSDISTKKAYGEWKSQPGDGCILMKYRLGDKQLTVWDGNDKAFNDAKEAKAFDDAAGFLAHIKAKGDAAFFPDANKKVYQRLR